MKNEQACRWGGYERRKGERAISAGCAGRIRGFGTHDEGRRDRWVDVTGRRGSKSMGWKESGWIGGERKGKREAVGEAYRIGAQSSRARRARRGFAAARHVRLRLAPAGGRERTQAVRRYTECGRRGRGHATEQGTMKAASSRTEKSDGTTHRGNDDGQSMWRKQKRVAVIDPAIMPPPLLPQTPARLTEEDKAKFKRVVVIVDAPSANPVLAGIGSFTDLLLQSTGNRRADDVLGLGRPRFASRSSLFRLAFMDSSRFLYPAPVLRCSSFFAAAYCDSGRTVWGYLSSPALGARVHLQTAERYLRISAYALVQQLNASPLKIPRPVPSYLDYAPEDTCNTSAAGLMPRSTSRGFRHRSQTEPMVSLVVPAVFSPTSKIEIAPLEDLGSSRRREKG
ncbi:hypothetical protein C8R44DRAFT_938208 [Mycena epipterygia]|nr:hypothetical protein C8R44DRAFT_938208 [Mycena epipterygia]